ncbi:MAG: D-glycero-beta-D-manno-heptose 1,7-bisphosphate 7-phosphatase [Betaproteobacteria bacterium]|nr:D-glycero-beta-D-manno-heptose 1,7-bisphosphate 7-phosphatase [Betaproteobacteria bacterium]MBL8532444.1 D-glycero-beta-D-manno-heptose 1,7-bisphosphate 7-phosphatase [Betaproteobacteria bacterium]
MTHAARKAVFLDRDGTLNVEKNYLYRYEDWEWIPGAQAAIRSLNRLDLDVIVVTNQAGIARGYYSEADVHRLHAQVDRDLAASGARVSAYYLCPHHPEYGERVHCLCRKPLPGMLVQAAHEHGIDLTRSWMVGDRESDMEAARRCGVRPLLVATGYGEQTRHHFEPDVPYFPSVAEAVRWIETH